MRSVRTATTYVHAPAMMKLSCSTRMKNVILLGIVQLSLNQPTSEMPRERITVRQVAYTTLVTIIILTSHALRFFMAA